MIGPGSGVVFDWEPTLTSTAELITARAAPTLRLDDNRRATRAERESDYHERMDAKAEARAELQREREAGIWADGETADPTRPPPTPPDDADEVNEPAATRSGETVTPRTAPRSRRRADRRQGRLVVDQRRERRPDRARSSTPSPQPTAAAPRWCSSPRARSPPGMPYLRLDARPTDLATQQAAAAVGQNLLIFRYQDTLDRYDIVAGQVLLTAGDLEHATPRGNAQRAMDRLLALRILPIVNENDTVATHEIRFGDNDRLAALVAELIGADLLVLLSDVDALYTRPPHLEGAERIAHVPFGDDLAGVEIGSAGRRASAPGERGPRSPPLASPRRPAPPC